MPLTPDSKLGDTCVCNYTPTRRPPVYAAMAMVWGTADLRPSAYDTAARGIMRRLTNSPLLMDSPCHVVWWYLADAPKRNSCIPSAHFVQGHGTTRGGRGVEAKGSGRNVTLGELARGKCGQKFSDVMSRNSHGCPHPPGEEVGAE